MFLIQLNQNTIGLAQICFLLKSPSSLVISCSAQVFSIVFMLETWAIESIFLTITPDAALPPGVHVLGS